ncbi:DUF6447 family protein [Paracoccaceae bacterium]|nr:DUF6447 family protein [Paracoccaceae bacterium]
MAKTIKFEDKIYNVGDLTETAKKCMQNLQFANERILELNNMAALLERAKKSYVDGLKKEMLAEKAGFFLGDE